MAINTTANSTDKVFDVDIDYGIYFAADLAHAVEKPFAIGRRKATTFLSLLASLGNASVLAIDG